MKSKTKVTIALSAYNEGENIVKFLKSLLKQKETTFDIDQIWVHSDGSTDNTVALAQSINSKKIKIFNHKKRIGKSARLNHIYRTLKTDILVQTDADVVFAHPRVIEHLIQPLISEKEVGMCGGHPAPFMGKTFTEKSINYSFDIYSKLRKEVRGGDNKFSVDGRLLAYKKELVKKIFVPEDMIANDLYTFFCCLTRGYKYRYVEKATVYFRSPTNLKDHLKQNIRFESAATRMKKYFPAEIVEREIHIPRGVFTKHLITQFLKAPINSLYIFIVNQYCRLVALKKEKSMTALWEMAISTKKMVLFINFFNI